MDGNLPETQVVIEKMATSDDDESVRLAAINSIATVSVLKRVNDSQSSNATITGAVQSRISKLLSDNSVSEAEANDLLAGNPAHYAPLLAINSPNEAIRQIALNKISDESALLKVVEQSRFHDVRMACANKIVDEQNIKAALLACRSRDKEVAKSLQARLDEKAQAQLQEKNASEAVESTLGAMQSLAESVWSPQYAGRHTGLSAKWNTLDAGKRAALEESFAQAQAKAQGVIEAHQKAEDQKAQDALQATNTEKSVGDSSRDGASGSAPDIAKVDQQAAEAGASTAQPGAAASSAVTAAPDPDRDALLNVLKPKTLDALKNIETQAAVKAGSPSEKLMSHAQAVGVLFDPPYDLAKGRPTAVSERIKRVKALLNTDSVLPGVNMDECVYMRELSEHAKALELRLEKAKQESVDRAKATHKQFAALASTIADGKWGPASSTFRRLQKKLDAMEPAERSQFSDKISKAEKQLAEMADWQDFAARPKLEALCDSMEGLPAKELKPEALAKEIKSLQAQWKGLGASRASNDLWSRFKTAGDTAYEPCKEYYEKKHLARQEKHDAKVALCDQLEAQFKTTNWEEPDWKALARVVNNAKRDWSRNRIPDRKPDKELEQRFSDALKPFNEKLAEQYEQNILEKRELIEKMQKLAEAEINQHSANQAKRLQSAWKAVGIVPRKDDQALWEEFNAFAKKIYQHQHEVKREQYKASMGHVFRARDIIKELRKLAKSSDLDEQKVQELQTEFQALADFPDKDKKFLLRDFRGAMDACSKVQASATKKRAQAETSEITRLVELCEQLEAAVELPDSVSDTLRDDVAHAWENSQASVAKETLSKLTKRRDIALKHMDAGTQYNYEANETHRRQLLIQMEILADKDTPGEDKALRMQYQLENLREGMTSSAVMDKRAELSKLAAQWFAAPPVKQSVKDSLQSRFLVVSNK